MITLEANSYTLSLTFDIGPVSLTGTGTLPGFLKILNGTNITVERTLEKHMVTRTLVAEKPRVLHEFAC